MDNRTVPSKELRPSDLQLRNEPEGAHDIQESDAQEVSPISNRAVSPISKRASREIPDQNFAEEVTTPSRVDDPQVKVSKADRDEDDDAQVSDIDESKGETHTITVSEIMPRP